MNELRRFVAVQRKYVVLARYSFFLGNFLSKDLHQGSINDLIEYILEISKVYNSVLSKLWGKFSAGLCSFQT